MSTIFMRYDIMIDAMAEMSTNIAMPRPSSAKKEHGATRAMSGALSLIFARCPYFFYANANHYLLR